MNSLIDTETSLETIHSKFNDFILNNDHPCIMAKSLFKMGKHHISMINDIEDEASLQILMTDLKNYLSNYDFSGNAFESFLAVFPNNHYSDEKEFENVLWKTLQTLHEMDHCVWDPEVSSDPENPNFSFSIGGKAFYVVGLHPESSRLARRAPFTTLVFNLHHQFEKLREMGTYQVVRDTIRKNDEKLQGSINPVLRDHGTDTEAKQYSGRKVEQNWKCPFHKK